MLSYILCQSMLQDFTPNNNMIFFTWHICPMLTHALCLCCSFPLCTQWDPCALIYRFCHAFDYSKKEIRKDYTKKPTPKIDLIFVFVLPFNQTACWQKFTSLFTGMFLLAAGILGTSQQLDFLQTYIHMISLYSHIWTFPR